ncbi:DUF362 domain-containing protein [Methanobacterium spitsbergense]|uniref:DUF362 domain-containing protein n=1 Tax=Methanobacterium spitsbergense TaxID=2874285 RepID=A0A8T5UXA7_9EURY|nr:DUF362 domain-containing protein [Methanobacterium spitsbergense]MBZ2165463.1 DUF362 domain-containing protein [Methanobacterium spitsbergense]
MGANEYHKKGNFIDSELGKKNTDSKGSPVCAARMDPSKAYAEIPQLLQKVINDDDPEAWAAIVEKIDYIYAHIDHSLICLDMETGFIKEVKFLTESGKKLLFKPNLVGPQVIEPNTHGEDLGAPICTDWSVIAALMRWFHDKLAINYHQMSLGEASTSSLILESIFSDIAGKKITSEAVFEGRSGDFNGGWGFYFVRKYLGEHHQSSHTDDPMKGYEDSIAGRYITPGKASDRLMVYDLNKLDHDSSRGRTVPVPEGENYKEITIHKVIIGGHPANSEDMKDYPGSILINVPKLKIHAQDLITNAIKNLGIGLYPTQCHSGTCDKNTWKYALPSTEMPSYKAKLPHMPWVVEMDDETNLPVKDENGKYLTTKTAGMPGTQADIIKAVQAQNVFMVHVSDSINMINLNHNAEGIAVRIPEGYIFSSLDCIAMDILCSRYCFKTVPMSEGLELKRKNNWNTEFVHHVPVAKIEGKNIITTEGLDSPLFRYNLYQYAEKRGLGQQQYYVTGWDSINSTPMASLSGHLGRIENNKFIEMMTNTMYYNPSCMLWDMQKTIMSYAEAHDTLTGSSIVNEFMEGFDENGDGIIDYDENGKKGFWTPGFSMLSHALDIQITQDYGEQKGSFYQTANFVLKHTDKNWSPQGHDFAKEFMLISIATLAFEMSKSEITNEDPFVPGMSWGNGMWPSWQLARWVLLSNSIYGAQSTDKISNNSLFGTAFSYADKTRNNGAYTGSVDPMISSPDAVNAYFEAVSKGDDSLDFTLYVPLGLGSLDDKNIPNVKETNDPNKIFTASFNNGQEIW